METAQYKLIVIERDPMTKIPKMVAPWEIAVFEAMFDSDEESAGFIETDATSDVVMDVPNAAEEFNRLKSVFGVHPDQKVSYAEIAYGRGKAGVRGLAAAIAEAFPDADVETAPADEADPLAEGIKAGRARKAKK